MMLKKVSWFLILLTMGVACLDEPDCFSLNNNLVGVAFRRMYDNTADTVALVSVSIGGTDSVFYEFQLRNGVDIPLNYLTDETDVAFHFGDPISGTEYTHIMRLGYDAKAQFVSEDCGERFILSDLEVLEHDFDSLRLVSATPARQSGATHINVYRCPVNNLVKFSFRQLYADTISYGKAREVYIDSITADYTPYVFNRLDTTTAVRLPLNVNAGTTTFNVTEGDSTNFITLGYTTSLKTLLTVCGEQKIFTDLTVVDHDFPIMKLRKDSLQDPAVTNVAFYRCPDTHLMKIQFKKSTATNAANDTLNITNINATHLAAPITFDEPQTSVTLPLDTLTDSSTFAFTIDGEVKTIQVSYSRESKTFHSVCNQTLITGLVIGTNDLGQVTIANEDIIFPTVTNLRIVKN